MNILYLSKNMKNYPSASYQQDVMDEFSHHHNVFFYGPGFSSYDKNDKIGDVIKKNAFNPPDLIIVGHAWLIDSPGAEVDPHPKIRLDDLNIPKVMILNKEYTNLLSKLDYVKRNKFDLVFTHHHETAKYEGITGIPFIFWPFAVNEKIFKYNGAKKDIDFIFTGILRNPAYPETQSDVRERVQKEIFFTRGQAILFKKWKYWRYRIFWQVNSSDKFASRINHFLNRQRSLSTKAYSEMMNRSKICFCSPSPLGLISPRYFEAMASRSMVLCEESELYEPLFEKSYHFVPFRTDLSDFREKITYYLKNLDEWKRITDNASAFVLENHTWKKRVEDFSNILMDRTDM